MSPADFDRWASQACSAQICGGYAAMLASETAHGPGRATAWLASKDANVRAAGWCLLAQLAQRDEKLPDAYFLERLAEVERTIHSAPNGERGSMNMAVIMIGCRNPALKKAALAAAKRIGKVEIDYGDTGCKTPDAAQVIEKTWAHSTSKGFASPAAHERTRDVPRRRC
jgi:cytosine/adenosine deaminase-related metal-dependent hydrolase